MSGTMSSATIAIHELRAAAAYCFPLEVQERFALLQTKNNEGTCEYCCAPLFLVAAVTTFHVEHIMPRSRGGQTVDSNLALSCPNCNLHKSVRITAVDLEAGAEVSLFNPRTPAWKEHFTLSADHAHIT
jgi:5-methylcytosine-specific restriction endonuclease McrA